MEELVASNTEKQILDVAEQLFLDKGFAMTSTTEIAKQVGCNQALVHYYYRSKEKLFLLIFRKKIETFANYFVSAGDESMSFDERLRLRMYAHFEMFQQNPKMPFMILNELTTNPRRLQTVKEIFSKAPGMVVAQLDKELKMEYEKGNIRQMSAVDVMLSAFSLNAGVFLMLPIIKGLSVFPEDQIKSMIEKRKEENYNIILRSLRK
jgi:TetR/AcrR family transcriptional regulator